jgi:uncharacterized protein YgiM (DUF1202 family)
MRKFGILFLLCLTISGCSLPQVQPTPSIDVNGTVQAKAATVFAHYTETSIAAIPTVTETPVPSPSPTLPPVTATNAPIPAPVEAVASNNVTVRSEPRKGAKNLGGIFFNQGMKVIARNDVASWYYIEWPKSPSGTAWVLGAAVDLKKNDLTHLPIAIINPAGKVIVYPPLIWTVNGTPLPLSPPATGAQIAIVKELIKVRVGPSLGYSVMGTLGSGLSVAVTGRTDNNVWLQIEYPSGPEGRGWVSGDLLDMKGAFAGLPFFNLLATPVSESQPAPDPNVTSEASATPEPTPAGPTGEVTASELIVRGGPAAKFDKVGTLKLGEGVVITGLTVNRLWYRIVYAAGPDGYGFVSIKYIKITGGDMRKLTYLNDQGTPLP